MFPAGTEKSFRQSSSRRETEAAVLLVVRGWLGQTDSLLIPGVQAGSTDKNVLFMIKKYSHSRSSSSNV